MMKHIIFTGVLVLTCAMASESMAACSGTQVTDTTGSGTQETATITFGTGSLSAGKNVTIGGLILTKNPGPGISVLETATAFANLVNNSTGGTNPANTTYGGILLTGWTSGAVVGGNTVTFTFATPGNATDLVVTTNDSNIISPTSPVIVQGTGGGLSTLLSGNTVCVGVALTSTPAAPWNNQEWHQAGGTITDWKLGASDPVDPTQDIGSWSISGTGASAMVNYNYTDGGVFNYTVWKNGVSAPFAYSFCNGSTEVAVGYIYSGQDSCSAPTGPL